jgi:3'-phosphoadenosine 5'-phosphosulfate synthase
MGSVVRVKILGSMELIDEGETDHKIIVLRESDPNFDSVNNMADFERVNPGVTARLVDWLKNYKTSDGKPQTKLKQDEPTTPAEALRIIDEVHGFYNKLIAGETPNPKGYYLPRH